MGWGSVAHAVSGALEHRSRCAHQQQPACLPDCGCTHLHRHAHMHTWFTPDWMSVSLGLISTSGLRSASAAVIISAAARQPMRVRSKHGQQACVGRCGNNGCGTGRKESGYTHWLQPSSRPDPSPPAEQSCLPACPCAPDSRGMMLWPMMFCGAISTKASALSTSAAPMLPIWMRSAAVGARSARMGAGVGGVVCQLAIQGPRRQRTACCVLLPKHVRHAGLLAAYGASAQLPAPNTRLPCTSAARRPCCCRPAEQCLRTHPPLLSPQSICFMMRMTPLRDRGVPCRGGGEEAEREGRQQQRVCLTTAQTEPREGAQALTAAGCSVHSWGQQAWPGQRWHVCGCTCAPACRDPAPSPSRPACLEDSLPQRLLHYHLDPLAIRRQGGSHITHHLQHCTRGSSSGSTGLSAEVLRSWPQVVHELISPRA